MPVQASLGDPIVPLGLSECRRRAWGPGWAKSLLCLLCFPLPCSSCSLLTLSLWGLPQPSVSLAPQNTLRPSGLHCPPHPPWDLETPERTLWYCLGQSWAGEEDQEHLRSQPSMSSGRSTAGMQPNCKAGPVPCLSPALPQKQRKAAEDWRGSALLICMSLNTLPWASENGSLGAG